MNDSFLFGLFFLFGVHTTTMTPAPVQQPTPVVQTVSSENPTNDQITFYTPQKVNLFKVVYDQTDKQYELEKSSLTNITAGSEDLVTYKVGKFASGKYAGQTLLIINTNIINSPYSELPLLVLRVAMNEQTNQFTLLTKMSRLNSRYYENYDKNTLKKLNFLFDDTYQVASLLSPETIKLTNGLLLQKVEERLYTKDSGSSQLNGIKKVDEVNNHEIYKNNLNYDSSYYYLHKDGVLSRYIEKAMIIDEMNPQTITWEKGFKGPSMSTVYTYSYFACHGSNYPHSYGVLNPKWLDGSNLQVVARLQDGINLYAPRQYPLTEPKDVDLDPYNTLYGLEAYYPSVAYTYRSKDDQSWNNFQDFVSNNPYLYLRDHDGNWAAMNRTDMPYASC